jgi:gluconate 2-dehydrogenase gamma chain
VSEATARMSKSISRRGFVAVGALAGVAAERGGAQSYSFFTPEQARLVEALADTIIPPDEKWPGGAEAGVASFLDRQLEQALRRFAPLYRMGLPALEATALRLTGKGFVEMSLEERTALLRQVEAGEAEGPEWPDFSAKMFLARAVDHAMQGFYGSPAHGGNKGEVSWAMLGVKGLLH